MSTLLPTLKKYASQPSIIERLERKDVNKDLFVATIDQVVNDNYMLQKCTPESIFKAALTAAETGLTVSPVFGYAYLVPYGQEAKFSIGYKGLIQLAQATGQYKKITATAVYEDEIESYNPLSNEFTFKKGFNKESQRFTGGTPIGYHSYFELLNGFISEVFMTRDEMVSFAKQYSKAYQNDIAKGKSNSPWSTSFDSMSIKTVIRKNLITFGPKNNSLQEALSSDSDSQEEAGTATITPVKSETVEAPVQKANIEEMQEAEVVETPATNEPEEDLGY